MAPPRHKQPCWLKGFLVLFKLKRFTDQGFFVHFCPDFFLIVSIQPSLPDLNSKSIETFLNFKTLKSLEIWEILFKLTKHSYRHADVLPYIVISQVYSLNPSVFVWGFATFSLIEIINNKARHNLINVKYHQMAFQSARWRWSGSFLGTPWSNESDAQPPEGDNPRNLLFSSRITLYTNWAVFIIIKGFFSY